MAKVCAFVYRFSDFLKVTIILIYDRHVRIKLDKDFVLKVIFEQHVTFDALGMYDF